MFLALRKQTGLDITLREFLENAELARLGRRPAISTEVLFLETHVGFDFTLSVNEKLLRPT